MHEPDDALAVLLAAVAPLAHQTIAAGDALGRVCAVALIAPTDQPAFPRAMMDGFAVRLADAGGAVELRREIAAGDGAAPEPLGDGSAYPIMTGAPVPSGAEAVVPIEKTTREGALVRLPERIKPGANIVGCGEELRRGDALLPAGAVVGPLALAALVAAGIEQLAVHPPPRIAVLTTGSELAAGDLGHGQIRDSNGPMLAALLAEQDWTAERGSVADDPERLAERLAALADRDAVLLTGGVSAGSHDDVPGVLRRLGADVILHKVAQKPGKPLLLARRGRQLIFGLPGNPLAAHCCACRYVIPALRRLAGLSITPLQGHGRLRLATPANADRTWFIPARVDADGDGYDVTPLNPVSSADLYRPALANAYLRLEPGAAAAAVGSKISFTWIGARAWT